MEMIRIGTRKSRLAAVQAELLKQYLESRYPSARVSLVKIKTEGDRILDKKLDEIGGQKSGQGGRKGTVCKGAGCGVS